MEVAIARLDGKARVVIPKRVREKVGIREHSIVYVYVFENLVCLRKVEVDEESVFGNVGKPGLAALAPSTRPRSSREMVIRALAKRPVMRNQRYFQIDEEVIACRKQ
jgi:AbrB family looped-hinge helix DNA binding protein